MSKVETKDFGPNVPRYYLRQIWS